MGSISISSSSGDSHSSSLSSSASSIARSFRLAKPGAKGSRDYLQVPHFQKVLHSQGTLRKLKAGHIIQGLQAKGSRSVTSLGPPREHRYHPADCPSFRPYCATCMDTRRNRTSLDSQISTRMHVESKELAGCLFPRARGRVTSRKRSTQSCTTSIEGRVPQTNRTQAVHVNRHACKCFRPKSQAGQLLEPRSPH